MNSVAGDHKMPDTLSQSWARITLPTSGAQSEAVALEVAATLAQTFSAQLNCLFTPPDPADIAPWLGEGFMASIQITTLDNLKTLAGESEVAARTSLEAVNYGHKRFAVLASPVWRELAVETRLSDLVVFSDDSARGRGLLSEAFQQVLMEERAAAFIARKSLNPAGTALVAWDGKEPSSRAARRALPLLKRAGKVIITGAPIGDDPVDLSRLADYYACHGIAVEIDRLPKTNDILGSLKDSYARHGADYLVAGAFGHSRLREFAFGGTTRALLTGTDINLFMAH
jgi:nucleotide-binding universal stress UspA family protein